MLRRSDPSIAAPPHRLASGRRGSWRTPDGWIRPAILVHELLVRWHPRNQVVDRLAYSTQEPLHVRIAQPARERRFLTPSGRAEFSHAGLPDTLPPDGKLILGTMRSHDQWNTTIYSNDDRYRGVKNLRTLVFMNQADMDERALAEMALVDITSIGRDGSRRSVYGYRALAYNIPRGNAAGYMPELNVLIPVGDFSTQSDQPLMKHIVVEIVPAAAAG